MRIIMRNITEIMMGVNTVKSFNSAIAEVMEAEEGYFMSLATHGVHALANGRWASFFDGTFDSKEECTQHNYEAIISLILGKEVEPLRSFIEECVIEEAPVMACGLKGYYIPLPLGGSYSSCKESLTNQLLSDVLTKVDKVFSALSSIIVQPALNARLMRMDLK